MNKTLIFIPNVLAFSWDDLSMKTRWLANKPASNIPNSGLAYDVTLLHLLQSIEVQAAQPGYWTILSLGCYLHRRLRMWLLQIQDVLECYLCKNCSSGNCLACLGTSDHHAQHLTTRHTSARLALQASVGIASCNDLWPPLP